MEVSTMARTTPRSVPTETQTLKLLLRHCPTCGETMWAAYHNYRTSITLTAVLGLTLQIQRCLNTACPPCRQPYRPEEEGRLEH
jgi:ribosomal protein S27AE